MVEPFFCGGRGEFVVIIKVNCVMVKAIKTSIGGEFAGSVLQLICRPGWVGLGWSVDHAASDEWPHVTPLPYIFAPFCR